MQITIAGIVGALVYGALRYRGWSFLAAWAVSIALMLPIWIIGDIIKGPIAPP